MQRHGGDFNIMYILLFCLCRQQRKLEHHDDRRDELERKEKGFMLYVNGANAAPSSVKTARTARRPKSCHKTAADCKACCLLYILCLAYLSVAVVFCPMYSSCCNVDVFVIVIVVIVVIIICSFCRH